MVEVGKANIRIPVRRIKCARGSFRYKTLSERKGIKALFCCPARKFRKGHCGNGMKAVTVLYSEAKWTPAKAKAHAKKRFKR
jgi:hypothetical protein